MVNKYVRIISFLPDIAWLILPSIHPAFFMRKGADCLSKWVGEVERQLRLLFEEAKACQPSIIFFDEIDGLAPVRSSKQDQIHASIVSTLLALMDGIEGGGCFHESPIFRNCSNPSRSSRSSHCYWRDQSA